jgi:hypothetical protein
MGKWLDAARAVSVPIVPIVPEQPTREAFGTIGTIGTPAEDTMAAFEERAAVCEYDGGLPRSHAELLALACTVPLAPSENP